MTHKVTMHFTRMGGAKQPDAEREIRINGEKTGFVVRGSHRFGYEMETVPPSDGWRARWTHLSSVKASIENWLAREGQTLGPKAALTGCMQRGTTTRSLKGKG